MYLSDEQAEDLVKRGVEEMRSGRAAEARHCFDELARSGRANAQTWLLLATACRMEHDLPAEEAALDELLALNPRAVRGHIMKGDCRARADDDHAALQFYTSALHIASGQNLPNDLLAELKRVEASAAQLGTRLQEQREALLAARGMPPERRSTRFQESIDIMAGRKQIYVQEPTAYYFPGLPHIQFFDPAEFAWASAVEEATDRIRNEMLEMLATNLHDFRPYIQKDQSRPRIDDNQLLDNADWSAFFLCENGEPFEERIARCPHTWAAVEAASLPQIPGSGPTVMFSMLRAGTRIAPHTGMMNTRLVCHLPLVVPPGCRFRVGNEVREWQVGKLLIFDDSIEHEAWNDSTKDRVILIFDIWRPELGEQERQEVAALLSGTVLE